MRIGRSAATTARASWRRLLAPLACVGLLGGCASGLEGVGYYWQSVSGHLALMRAARPLEAVIDDPATQAEVADKLRHARAARAFAASHLGLPANGSYTRYADLGRPFVLWNVFATPELSMRLERWCFPVAGCIAYRGYYDREDALAFAAGLRERGMDVRVGGVPAYSTLGWFDDPIPSTVMRYPRPEIARLIFHELAHQVVYVKGDTTFNESFATAVERLGIERWLAHELRRTGDPAELERYRQFAARKADFLALLSGVRDRLEALYRSDLDEPAKRQGKAAILATLRSDYEAIKAERWGGWSGYDGWFRDPVGNAHLAAVGAYHDRVDAFLALFEQQGRDFSRLYAAVRDLAGLAPQARAARLDALEASTAPLAGR